jgi:uncharacterized cupin superfamily protein
MDFLGNQIEYLHTDPGSLLSLLTWLMPGGTTSPPVHVHRRTDEGFYVLRGEITVLVDDERSTHSTGAYVHVRRGQRHTFWNPGASDAEYLVIITPSGFERYFRDLADRLARATSQEDAVAARMELSTTYDIDVVGPPIQP